MILSYRVSSRFDANHLYTIPIVRASTARICFISYSFVSSLTSGLTYEHIYIPNLLGVNLRHCHSIVCILSVPVLILQVFYYMGLSLAVKLPSGKGRTCVMNKYAELATKIS